MLMIIAISYVLSLGIEVLARTAEVFIVILILIGLIGNMLIYLLGNVDFHNLQPILENGWKPILKLAFPVVISFPFGKALVFTMILLFLSTRINEKSLAVGLNYKRTAFKLYSKFENCRS
ncbi:GerAB/ArcD/ProY family transporter [Metabacillus litoralis]|jgi:spore germination protein KB|uniref:GerAB/ArcD/ProY family transporter n=1 Tax=Metabacillus litoralis TaxID=152268 RepID=UPI00203B1AA8|nr:GerAB/ArcD/ProY family transporter [Metabacillus litoralis]